MKYAYYPGCSAHSTARDMHESCLAVAKALGIELNEIKGWTCCGASAAHQTDRELGSLVSLCQSLLGQEDGHGYGGELVPPVITVRRWPTMKLLIPKR